MVKGTRRLILAVDFDRTLQDNDNRPEGRVMGPPMPGAEAVLSRLKEQGAYIIIHSCRANEGQRSIEVMKKWLEFFDIPYDAIWGESPSDRGKPIADVYIDDRGVKFNSWKQIEELLLEGSTSQEE